MSVQSTRMYGPDGWARRYKVRLAGSDAFVVALVLVFVHATWFGWDPLITVAGPSAPPYWQVTVAIGLLWLANLAITRSREPRILGHGPQEFQRVFAAGWWTFAVVAIIGYLTQWSISRSYLIFAVPLGTSALIVYRWIWRTYIHAQRDRGGLQALVLVVGPRRTSQQMIERLSRSRRAGYSVIGACVPGGGGAGGEIAGVPELGEPRDAVAVAVNQGAEFVLISGTDEVSLREARRIGWQLEGTGIGLIVAPAMVDVAGPRVTMSPVEGLPLLHVDPATFSGSKYLFKEIFDRLGALLILTLAAIPMACVAALIKVTSPGPVLFKQERIGLDGRAFAMLKFRSMVADAEAQLHEVMGGDVGIFYKAHDDPRVTKVGRVLRRFSIDELPQLLNVLKGDMSMVGPRPQVAAEVELYGDLARRRLLVKPGMTGLWQVSGRSGLSPEESIRLDAYYAENWSIGGDAAIILRTVKAVLGRDGAY